MRIRIEILSALLINFENQIKYTDDPPRILTIDYLDMLLRDFFKKLWALKKERKNLLSF